jgi:hypothetical protein
MSSQIRKLGTKRERIIKRRLSGQRPQQIVKVEDCSLGYVYNVISQARRDGITFPSIRHLNQETRAERVEETNSYNQVSSDEPQSQNTIQLSRNPDLAPYENQLRQLTEAESILKQKANLIHTIEQKRESIHSLRETIKTQPLRVLAKRMHQEPALYRSVMWQLYYKVPEIHGQLNSLALKLCWGSNWKRELDSIFVERFYNANYLLRSYADVNERAIRKRLELVIEPTFALDEWEAILESLRFKTLTLDEMIQLHSMRPWETGSSISMVNLFDPTNLPNLLDPAVFQHNF